MHEDFLPDLFEGITVNSNYTSKIEVRRILFENFK